MVPRLGNLLINSMSKKCPTAVEEAKQASVKNIQDAIDPEKSQEAVFKSTNTFFMSRGLTLLWPGKATYRKRLHRAHKEGKNRLDYHISVQNTMCQKEQEHVARWVEKHVGPSASHSRKGGSCQVHGVLQLLAKKARASQLCKHIYPDGDS